MRYRKTKHYFYLGFRKSTIATLALILFLLGLGVFILVVRKNNQGRNLISPVTETAPTPTERPRKRFTNTGMASWYGTGENECLKCPKYYDENGVYYLMSNRERLDDDKLTVAHKTIPLGTKIKFLNDRGDGSGHTVVATVKDRGPYVKGRSWDFSKAVWSRLGGGGKGEMVVRWEVVE